jgi:steroid delta-isomerase-like uncharacterized protein
MSAEENEQLVRRVVQEIWGNGDLAPIDQIYAPSYVDRTAPPGVTAGLAELKALISAYRAAFPDLRCRIDDIVASDDHVAARWTAEGTHLGEFLGVPATGKRMSTFGMSMTRIQDGRIQEDWIIMDQVGVLRQLGFAIGPGTTDYARAAPPQAAPQERRPSLLLQRLGENRNPSSAP